MLEGPDEGPSAVLHWFGLSQATIPIKACMNNHPVNFCNPGTPSLPEERGVDVPDPDEEILVALVRLEGLTSRELTLTGLWQMLG